MSTRPTTKRATSADVARRAGLSRSTVSQILNGDERFPLETRERVQDAAKALGYRPSRAGRALVTGLSDIVVVVVPNATFGPHLQDSVDRITRASALSGMSVVVRFGTEESTLTSVLDLRPAAVVSLGVFTAAQRSQIEALGTRIVPEHDEASEGGDPDPFDILIGRLQVQELVRAGFEDIVYAGLDDGRLDPFGPPRLEGIVRECEAQGLAAPRVVRVQLDTRDAVRALDEARGALGGPIGICAYNDDVAIAVLAGARERNMTVPRDLAVVGVDHTAIGQLVSPRLTTVRIDLAALMDDVAEDLADLHARRTAPQANPERRDPARLLTLVRGETS
ncbi:LacI family DNA-binding transcriptional regulator [Microbacterium sp. NPDC055903]